MRSDSAFKNENLPCEEIMPEGPDSCKSPPVEALTEQLIDSVVAFSDIYHPLPDLIASWHTQVHQCFFTHVGPSNLSTLRTEDPFNEPPVLRKTVEALASLATSVFRCSRCDKQLDRFSTLFYPEVLVHRCWTRIPYSEANPSARLNRFESRGKWDCTQHMTWQYQRKLTLLSTWLAWIPRSPCATWICYRNDSFVSIVQHQMKRLDGEKWFII